MPGAGTDKTKRWVAAAGRRSSSWSSRRWARTSARRRAPWRISGCRGCGWSSRGEGWPNEKARVMAAGADRILDDAVLYDSLDEAIADCTLRAGDDRARSRPGQARDRRGGGGAEMAPRVAAGETVAHRVRARAQRAGKPRGRARRPHRHAAGQSGLRLAQSGAGGGDRRLRMVQACRPRRAAVRQPRAVAAGGQAAARRVLCRSWSANWTRSNSSGPPTSATPCRSTCATSSSAWRRPSRTSARCTASSRRSPQGRKGPARGGVLDGDEARSCATLLAEHGAGRAPSERTPVRGLPRLLRRNPTDAERAAVAGAGQRPPLRRPRLQAAGADRPAHRRFRVVPARMRDRSGAGGRRRGGGSACAPKARRGCEAHGYRVVGGEGGGGRGGRGSGARQARRRRCQPFSAFICAAAPSRRIAEIAADGEEAEAALGQASARSALAQ